MQGKFYDNARESSKDENTEKGVASKSKEEIEEFMEIVNRINNPKFFHGRYIDVSSELHKQDGCRICEEMTVMEERKRTQAIYQNRQLTLSILTQVMKRK